MTELTIYTIGKGMTERGRETRAERIEEWLKPFHARFSQSAPAPLPADATPDWVMGRYNDEIARMKAEGGYQSADVVRVPKGAANTEAMRAKFLSEHIHAEDEVRYFLEGQGAFYLRNDENVLRLVCTAGDLLSVPAGTRHWFDMGAEPCFTALRLFTNPDGWVAQFTGDAIADRVPRIDG